MKKTLLLLLFIPFILLSGLGYGLLAQKLVRDREPWYTMCMLGGLGATIAFFVLVTDISTTWAVWTFAGTGGLYLGLRLLFGPGSALEMMVPTHMLAILAMLFWPVYHHSRNKASIKPALHGAVTQFIVSARQQTPTANITHIPAAP